ncbi:hypothetical protein AA313_de0202647 [Arthrobotrys entomopaga]|nr:hypothetical protein AA313_de0202647 [Arthrobotrys entomopaga]
MQFQFIDAANIDASARKQIRSSVMRGRNTGKKRRRETPARPNKQRVLIPDLSRTRGLNGNTSDSESSEDANNPLAQLVRSVGNDFGSISFPLQLEPYMQKTILQSETDTGFNTDGIVMQMTDRILYPKDLCYPIQESRSAWFGYFQSNEAFFHCLLAMAQAHADWLVGSSMGPQSKESTRTLKHLGQTYHCVNRNLREEAIPSNATVAVVMSITMHNNLLRAPGGAEPHLNALQRMVEMRGGINQFAAPSRMLLHKICRYVEILVQGLELGQCSADDAIAKQNLLMDARTDLEYALQKGTRPRFYRDEFPYSTICSMSSWTSSCYEGFVTMTKAQVYDINTQTVFRDLLCVSRFFDTTHEAHPKLEPFAFQEVLISASYRILSAYPLATKRPSSAPENACQLALLAMITTMLMRSAHHEKSCYLLIANLLESAIDRLLCEPKTDETFLLWLLFMAGMAVPDMQYDGWLLPEIKKCIDKLGLDSWVSANHVLTGYPWIRLFHQASGEELWDKAMEEQNIIGSN